MKNINLKSYSVIELESKEVKLISGGGFWYDIGYAIGGLFTGSSSWDTPGVRAYNTSSYAK